MGEQARGAWERGAASEVNAQGRIARTLSKTDAEVTLPTMVVECASCRPSCWLLGRARPSSVEGGRGAGRGLNPPSSGAGGSGGGGTTVKSGCTGECAEAVTATIPCSRSPRAIDRRRQEENEREGQQRKSKRLARFLFSKED